MTDPIGTTQAFYTRWARVYDLIASRTPGVGDIRTAFVEAMGLAPGATVVEMGCGTGANFAALRDRVGAEGAVVGVDFTPGVLSIARDRIAREGWQNVHVVRADATRPPFSPAGDVDAVVSSFVMGMLSDPAAAVDDWADLVGPGGHVGLLDLARSSARAGRPLNGLFGQLVRLGAPPGSHATQSDPVGRLDRRVAAAHRRLEERCVGTSFETRALGFARLRCGTVG
ncbi:class I SAM-dependent methyltransferase [Haloferacaceae archaeon DSL9]